jgi:glycosyltransferase involved in cell wall biosynthesis
MKVLFVTSVSQSASNRNLNHFQHVHHLSRTTDFAILGTTRASFAAARPGTPVFRARFSGKLGIFLEGLRFALAGRAREYDIVLTDPSLLGLVGWMFKRAGARRWVVDVWDIPGRYSEGAHWLNGFRRAAARWLLRSIYRSADLFIVSILPEFELAAFRIPEDRMLRCKNAIWLDDMMPPQDAESPGLTILCMRSVHTKPMGLDTLAAAYVEIAGEFPGVRLVLIGRVPAHVAEQVAPLEGRADVERVEHLEHDALQRAIADATVCVIPFHDVNDLRQTYPVKVLEYMALGKPIVASGIAGMSRMIADGETGLLYRPGDAKDLAAKLRLLCRDPALRRRLSRNARRAAEGFDCNAKNEAIRVAMEKLL